MSTRPNRSPTARAAASTAALVADVGREHERRRRVHPRPRAPSATSSSRSRERASSAEVHAFRREADRDRATDALARAGDDGRRGRSVPGPPSSLLRCRQGASRALSTFLDAVCSDTTLSGPEIRRGRRSDLDRVPAPPDAQRAELRRSAVPASRAASRSSSASCASSTSRTARSSCWAATRASSRWALTGNLIAAIAVGIVVAAAVGLVTERVPPAPDPRPGAARGARHGRRRARRDRPLPRGLRGQPALDPAAVAGLGRVRPRARSRTRPTASSSSGSPSSSASGLYLVQHHSRLGALIRAGVDDREIAERDGHRHRPALRDHVRRRCRARGPGRCRRRRRADDPARGRHRHPPVRARRRHRRRPRQRRRARPSGASSSASSTRSRRSGSPSSPTSRSSCRWRSCSSCGPVGCSAARREPLARPWRAAAVVRRGCWRSSLAPLVLSSYLLTLLTLVFIAGLLAASVNYLAGEAGLVSMGQAGIAAAAAYGVAYATVRGHDVVIAGRARARRGGRRERRLRRHDDAQPRHRLPDDHARARA